MTKARYVVVESTSLRTVVHRIGGSHRNIGVPASPTAARQVEESKEQLERLKRRKRKRNR